MLKTKTKTKTKKTPSTAVKKSSFMSRVLTATEYFLPVKEKDTIEGRILKFDRLRLYVDLGKIGTGVIYGRELKEVSDWIKKLKEGDVIPVKIVDLENEEGYVELSIVEASLEKAWDTLRENKENGQAIVVKVVDANQGGLIVNVNGIFGFLPVSHLNQEHYPRVQGGDKSKIYQMISKLINQSLNVKIIDLDQKANKLIVSERIIEDKEVAEALRGYKVGDIVEGIITGVTKFGAFLRFGEENIEGLIHISELDWQIIDNPNDFLKVGQKVKAEIISIEGNRVSLSLKHLRENPWDKVMEKYPVGSKVKGKVIKINPFGAFVEIEKGVQGLVHISEFENYEEMEKKLKLDKSYNFIVNSLEIKEYRMSLKKVSTKEN